MHVPAYPLVWGGSWLGVCMIPASTCLAQLTMRGSGDCRVRLAGRSSTERSAAPGCMLAAQADGRVRAGDAGVSGEFCVTAARCARPRRGGAPLRRRPLRAQLPGSGVPGGAVPTPALVGQAPAAQGGVLRDRRPPALPVCRLRAPAVCPNVCALMCVPDPQACRPT